MFQAKQWWVQIYIIARVILIKCGLKGKNMVNFKLHELPIWFAGEVGNSLYFYTVLQENSKVRTYTFYELISDEETVPAFIDFREIGTLTTEKYIKFALQQPYFLNFEDSKAEIKTFESSGKMSMNRANSTMLNGIESESFNFFVWRGPLVVVRRNSDANYTSITREIFYDMELCVITVQDDLPTPTSVFTQDDKELFLLCGATLFSFKDDYAYATHKIDPPGYRIGGAENRRLFLNATMRFFSHDLPESRDPEDTKYVSRFSTDYEVTGLMGIGGGGCVFDAVNKHDEVKYAVKRIHVDPRHMDEALKEVRALAKLDHMSIVRYHSTWVETPPDEWQYEEDVEILTRIHSVKYQLLNYNPNSVFIYIQMQLGIGDMAGWLRKHQTPESRPLLEMKSFFKQIVHGVKYLHDNNFIHRDLKPGNILFFDGNRLKICDMGIVIEKRVQDGQEVTMTQIGSGTLDYMSPEQRSLIPQLSTKSDIFTLGLIFSEFCVVMDYEQKVKVFDGYRKGTQQDIFGDDFKTAGFVRVLTKKEKSKRPSCREILHCDYMSGNNSICLGKWEITRFG
ncbi:hypothetical protein PRIPAC_90907 [Pristionchus pacificus]|uniref:Protein kinase domain-containing protein n=1 Tax=Pristionchus pacificus TaxID=54126 RepID=A0A2A6CWK4_PRIPA|nr:hypothetical protein PRIPAC_90907 [Pristionchus pacificus]|eukprot:PDM82466.1 protein kinase [Pristionchus pacificus]